MIKDDIKIYDRYDENELRFASGLAIHIKEIVLEALEERDKLVNDLKQEVINTKEEAFHMGYKKAVDTLQNFKGKLSDWSHSRDLKFAPVELGDYLILQFRKENK